VGHNEESIADMGRADVTCSDTAPRRIVPRLGQVPENGSEPPSKQAWNVFHDCDKWQKLANASQVFTPQSRVLAREERSFAGETEIGTGESAVENIDTWQIVCARKADIDNAPVGIWPVFREHSAGEFGLFNLPQDARHYARFGESGLQSNGEPSDACKKGSYSDH
jgi:hypothetical protein